MNFSDSALARAEEKLSSEGRISPQNALELFRTKDLIGLGYLADRFRKKKAGDIVTFVGNYHICFTNVCVNHCRHCLHRRDSSDSDAFILSMEQIEAAAEESKAHNVPEILFFGAIHPELRFSFFVNAIEGIRRRIPEIKILAFSPIEIDHFAHQESATPREILRILKRAGLSAITGGGAEIFSDRIRQALGSDQKIGGRTWLEIMACAHEEGVRSNASMLYGAGETDEERIEHLSAVREVQDRTGGFTHFLPFAFSSSEYRSATGWDDFKVLAISRLFLDNFIHIRAYWSHLGLAGAQLALAFGADDLNGLKQKGRIIHSSGGSAGKSVSRDEMIHIIKDAGRIPAERDILFNLVKIFD